MDLVTGVTGQDGGYLAELLLTAGRRAVGLVLPGETLPSWVTALQGEGLGLAACDLAEPLSWRHLLRELKPERVFHCAAISIPQEAAADTRVSQQVNVTSVEVLCDWLRRDAAESRALVMSSSAIFGSAESAFDESSELRPEGEYAAQKVRVLELAREARGRGQYCACAIPFNHESPRRPDSFVLPKICRAAARINRGLQHKLALGALTPQRDWGYAPEYAQALVWMLDVPDPLELVLATGEGHSVQEAVERAFGLAGLNWREHIDSDSSFMRAADPRTCVGNARRAFAELGWEARTRFSALISLLYDAALGE